MVRTQAFQAWNRSSILRGITSVNQNTSRYSLKCFDLESKLLYFRADVIATVMSQKSCIPDFSETDEAGSRVLMSNPRKAWLAQLVTCDHRNLKTALGCCF